MLLLLRNDIRYLCHHATVTRKQPPLRTDFLAVGSWKSATAHICIGMRGVHRCHTISMSRSSDAFVLRSSNNSTFHVTYESWLSVWPDEQATHLFVMQEGRKMHNESYGYYRDLQPNTTSSTPDALRYLAMHLYDGTVTNSSSLHIIWTNLVTYLLEGCTITQLALCLKIAIALTHSA